LPADCLIPALNTTYLASSEECVCKAVSMRGIDKVRPGDCSIGTPTLDLPMWVARQLNLTPFDTRSRRRRKRGNFGPAPAQHEPNGPWRSQLSGVILLNHTHLLLVIAILMGSPVDIHSARSDVRPPHRLSRCTSLANPQPAFGHKALLREEATLIVHFFRTFDPIPQIDVGKPEAARTRDMVEDHERAE
jgi:hypothetical protein